MAGVLQDRGTLRGIAATLLTLALVAERAAGRSFPVRFLVLAILGRAEAIGRAFVAGAIEVDWPELPCLAEPLSVCGGPAEAERLALRLHMLAAVLGALADVASDDCSDDWSADGSAGWSPSAGGAVPPAYLILLRVFPDRRRGSCRSPPRGGIGSVAAVTRRGWRPTARCPG